ncbi:MAG: hypothetical protein AB7P69_03750 [Candidatus Binatia bacterium]
MPRIDDATREAILDAFRWASGSQRRVLVKDLARSLKLSEGYLYRLAQTARPQVRTPRRDVGARRMVLTPEIETFMAALTKQADASASHILHLTAQYFGLPANFMSVTTYNAWLRRQRLSRRENKRDLRPHRRFEAARPNDLHHYDTTVAEAYYLNDDGSIGYEPGFKRYKNKPGNKRPRLILYALIDDHSRVFYARFYVTENAFNLLDFVFHAWSQKEDKRFPFYGLPTAFYADLGSPSRSARFLNAMQKLGVAMVATTPSSSQEYGSRKHGKVERLFGEGLLGEFMKLTLIYRFASIEELNATLFEWLIWKNNSRHSVTKNVRFTRWLMRVGTPRSMPNADLFNLLHYEHTARVVTGNLQLSLHGRVYQLPYERPYINWVGLKVEVYWYPGQADKISVVYDHHEAEISALAPVIDLALDYKRAPKTDREERVAILAQHNFSTVNIPDMYNTDLPYLPKKGAQFESAQIAAKTITTDDGVVRPSFAPVRWLNRFDVARDIRAAGYVLDSGQTDMALVDAFMNGREQITDEELKSALQQHAPGKTGTEDF